MWSTFGSASRSSTDSKARPINSSVGASEAGRWANSLSREAVYPASGRDASVTATQGVAPATPLRSSEAAA